MTYHITLTDPMNGTRDREPITFILPEKLQEPLWWAITDEDARILCQRLEQESSASRTAFIATVSFSGTLKMRLDRPLTAAEVSEIAGIHRLPGREKDCFVRLNTGCFDLEMCRGTARASVHPSGGCAIFARCRIMSSCFLPEITPLAGFTARFLPRKWADKPAGAHPR